MTNCRIIKWIFTKKFTYRILKYSRLHKLRFR